MPTAESPRIANSVQAAALAHAGRWVQANGWAPATSGNFSVRDGEDIAISTSGRDKSQLEASDIMLLDREGRPMGPGKPSAEAALHVGIYRRRPDVGSVLHTHSIAATVISRRIGPGGILTLVGYELAKAFRGITDHRTALRIPVLANSQDMSELGATADAAMDADPHLPAYLIAGHGTYTWAADLATARMQVEALEFLFACELHHKAEATCPS